MVNISVWWISEFTCPIFATTLVTYTECESTFKWNDILAAKRSPSINDFFQFNIICWCVLSFFFLHNFCLWYITRVFLLFTFHYFIVTWTFFYFLYFSLFLLSFLSFSESQNRRQIMQLVRVWPTFTMFVYQKSVM